MVERLYQQLSERGRLTPEELKEVLPGAGDADFSPVETESELAGLLAKLAGCETVDLRRVSFQMEALELVPAKLVRATHVLPLYLEDDILIAAQYDPLDVMAADRVRRICPYDVRVVCTSRAQLMRYLDVHYGSQEQAAVERLIDRSRSDVLARESYAGRRQPVLFAEYEEDLGRTPVEQLLAAIVSDAVKRRATDIHITCHGDQVELRHRVDGVLREGFAIPKEIHASLLSRVKLSSGMDIASQQVPSGGHVRDGGRRQEGPGACKRVPHYPRRRY